MALMSANLPRVSHPPSFSHVCSSVCTAVELREAEGRGGQSSGSRGVWGLCRAWRCHVHVPNRGLGLAGNAMLFVSAGNLRRSEVVTAELMEAQRARSTFLRYYGDT